VWPFGQCPGHLVGIFYAHLVYFMPIWYILWPFGIFYAHLTNLCPFGIIYAHLTNLWPFGIFYAHLTYFIHLVCCSKETLATLFLTSDFFPSCLQQ
jgi:hypothetical protein